MEVFEFIQYTRDWLLVQRRSGRSIGLVPTMGALHEGHIALVNRARQENDVVACSIFVNPIQFNNPEDLEKYPRTLENDLFLLREAGCDVVFVPPVSEMYPGPVTKKYNFGPLESVMEGKYRPGHFNGVAIVVKKLFDIFQPDRAYFGEKDYQQLCVIRALVGMEHIPVEIVACPTVRESDGLAMSSRNRRLTGEERTVAPEIYQAMQQLKRSAGKAGFEGARKLAEDHLTGKGFVIDYIELASTPDLVPLSEWPGKGPARIFVAAFLGKVRLIDNLEIIS